MRSIAILSFFALCAISMAIDTLRAEDPPSLTNRADKMLANVSSAVTATKMDAQTLRLDEAAESAEKVKAATTRAEQTQAISREDATKIKQAADNVQRAAATGDHAAVVEHAEKLHDRLDDIVASKKGPEVADNLKRADEYLNKPVLSTPEDEKLLRDAVAEVVRADELIPPEKKQEATDYTVKTMKEGFRNANTTNKQLMTQVEMRAANTNKTTDRDDLYKSVDGDVLKSDDRANFPEREEFNFCCRHEGHWEEWEREHHRCFEWKHERCELFERRFPRQVYASSPYYYSSYYPSYYYGYGFNQCLYWSPWSYCRGRLFGDWAFYHGFHHFYHNHFHFHFHGGRGGGRGGHGRG